MTIGKPAPAHRPKAPKGPDLGADWTGFTSTERTERLAHLRIELAGIDREIKHVRPRLQRLCERKRDVEREIERGEQT